MFNKFFLVVFSLVLFTSGVFALEIVFPVSADVSENSTIELGKISPGQQFELIISDERFNAVEVTGSFSSWSEDSVFYEKNTGIKINVPFDASLGAKNISFKAFNSSSGLSESFNALVNVRKDLWSVNISGLSQTAEVNFPVNYKLTFSNESIGKQKISVSSNLTSYWMKEKTFVVEPKSVLKDLIEVNPRHYGTRAFNFVLKSSSSAETKEFQSKLRVESSLLSKYSSPLYGFPFFTPTLFPYYLVESFVGFFLK